MARLPELLHLRRGRRAGEAEVSRLGQLCRLV